MAAPQPFLHRAFRIPGERRHPTRFAPRLSRVSAPQMVPGTNYSVLLGGNYSAGHVDSWRCGIFATIELQQSRDIDIISLQTFVFPPAATLFMHAGSNCGQSPAKRCKQAGSVSFSTGGSNPPRVWLNRHDKGGVSFMKKLALATAAVLALLSIAGCAQVGKGKAPPPVVTKG